MMESLAKTWITLLMFYLILNMCDFAPANVNLKQFTWIKNLPNETVVLRYFRSFQLETKVRCASLCFQEFNNALIYMKEGKCYCLAPDYTPLSETVGEVTLAEVDYFYQKYVDKSECVSRNYTIFPGANYCVKLISTSLKWREAEEYCVQDGGHLASIENSEKMTHVSSVINGFGRFYQAHVGAYMPEGVPRTRDAFRWVSGTSNDRRINDGFWNINEPNALNSDFFVELYSTSYLNNRRPDYTHIFICELYTVD